MFQFHNGTIKRKGIEIKVFPQICFNSIMVRLKAFLLDMVYNLSEEFQFHNGTIKRISFFLPTNSKLEFQFHNGTIKRNAL